MVRKVIEIKFVCGRLGLGPEMNEKYEIQGKLTLTHNYVTTFVPVLDYTSECISGQ